MSSRLLGTAASFLLVGALAAACAHQPGRGEVPDATSLVDRTRGCALASQVSAPLVIEWNGTSRGQLEALRAQHLVVVRYTGCELQVLPACRVKSVYTYAPLTPKHERVRVQDERELYANLPLDAVTLSGKLRSAGEIDVAMSVVGRFDAPTTRITPDQLEGECESATHVVVGLSMGSFELTAGTHGEQGAGVQVGPAGGGAKARSSTEILNRDGSEEACAKASASDRAPPFGCGAVLRVELAAVGGTRPGAPSCPEGLHWDGTQCGNRPGPPATPPPPPPGAQGMVRIPGASYRFDGREMLATVETFDLDRTEVSVAAYQACVDAGRCAPPRTSYAQCNWGKDGRANHPVNCVSWDDARAYCGYAGERLPTDLEWQFAAVGQTASAEPWGNAPRDASRACAVEENNLVTCPVGSSPAGKSPFGVLDMGGHIAEWMLDAHCEYGRCDPKTRTLRDSAKITDRHHRYTSEADPKTAIRCARTVPPAQGPRACPAGTLYSLDACVSATGSTCPAGMHEAPASNDWVRGCVADGML